MEIKQIEWNNYVKEESFKKQIVLHLTLSGNGIDGDIAHWKNNYSTVSTHFIIERDGTINQLFDTKYWSRHLGINNKVFKQNNLPVLNLDKHSIGIEIDNWGGLKKIQSNLYETIYGNKINLTDDRVIYIKEGFMGFQHFEQLTFKQLKSIKQLLLKLSIEHKIPLVYNKDDMYNLSNKALQGLEGLYTHRSFRYDKIDLPYFYYLDELFMD